MSTYHTNHVMVVANNFSTAKAFILFKVSKLSEGDDSLNIKQYPQFYNYATVLNGTCTTVVTIIFYSFHLAIVHVHNA